MSETEKGRELIRQWNDNALSTHWSAQFAGLESGDINNIINGTRKKPKKETLIQIGIGFEKDFEEIDKLLSYFGEKKLDGNDFRALEKICKKRKFNSNIIPIYPGMLNFAISILSIELIPGDIDIVTDGYIHAALKKEIDIDSFCRGMKHYGKLNIENEDYNYLGNEILKQRRNNIKEILNKNKVTHIVCKDCFKRTYFNSFSENKDILVECINFLEKYDNFNFFISNNCCKFEFELKYESDNNMISFFAGKFNNSCEQLSGENDNTFPLTSFATTNKHIFKMFKQEFDRLKNDLFIDNKKDCIGYINSLINK